MLITDFIDTLISNMSNEVGVWKLGGAAQVPTVLTQSIEFVHCLHCTDIFRSIRKMDRQIVCIYHHHHPQQPISVYR